MDDKISEIYLEIVKKLADDKKTVSLIEKYLYGNMEQFEIQLRNLLFSNVEKGLFKIPKIIFDKIITIATLEI